MMGNVEPSLPVGQIDIFPMETSQKSNNDEELQKEEDFHCTAYDEQSSLSIKAKNFFTWCSLRLMITVAKFDMDDRFYPGDSIAYFPLLELEETTSNVRAAKDELVKTQEETIQKEAMTFPSQDLSNEDEDNDNFIQNGASPVQRRGHKQFHPTEVTKVLLLIKEWIWLLLVILLTALPKFSCASNTVECPTEQHVWLNGRAVVKCDGLGDFPFVYWYNNTNDDATAFIQKVNGEVAGTGYTTGEFDIDNQGSLVINNVKIRDERTFRVRVLDTALLASSYDITLIVYVEPAEPLPVIPECSGQSTCILKGDSYRSISCIHGESRPAMEVSWFLRVGTQDRRLNATVNQTVSGDALTFTTSAKLVLEKIPIDANMNPLLVLVCKSSQPVPGMKGAERIVLLDLTVDVPVTNEEYLDTVYAFEKQEDFVINCQFKIDTRNNIVLWTYKPLNSDRFEYIVYSAYNEVAFFHDANAQFNLTNDGALVIKQVEVQHEGYYACESSSEIATVSFVYNLAVIVLPKPPRIVVQGCEPFQPCHLSAEEAESITCTVNGVRPQVYLSIVTSSMNVAVTKTATTSHKEDGLFYTTIEGRVDVSEITCGKNVTVFCQAQGPAAYGFMSVAYVTVPVDGDDCDGTSTDMEIPDDGGSGNYRLGFLTMLTMALLPLVLLIPVIMIMCHRRYREKLQRISENEMNQSMICRRGGIQSSTSYPKEKVASNQDRQTQEQI